MVEVEVSNMRSSWWLGRLKRLMPWMLLVLLLWIMVKNINKGQSTLNPAWSLTTTTSPPPTDPPPPSRWVVVLASADYCTTLASAFQGWDIALVGLERQSQFVHSRCHYISQPTIEAFRKNHGAALTDRAIGYLHAIKMGADVIHPLADDEDPRLAELPRQLYTEKSHRGLVVQAHEGEVFSPSHHWGCNSTTGTRDDVTSYSYRLCDHGTPAIQAAVRLPNHMVTAPKENGGVQYLQCDLAAPSVTLGEQTTSFLDVNRAVYMKEAFWALPVHAFRDRIETAVFGVLVQKTLWYYGQKLLVYYNGNVPTEVEYDNIFSHVKEVYLSLIALQLPETVDGPIDLLIWMTKELVNKQLIRNNILQSLIAWDELLRDTGYSNQKSADKTDICSNEPVTFIPVNHSVPYILWKWRTKPFLPIANLDSIRTFHEEWCQEYTPSSNRIDFSGSWVQFDEMLLIIVFNNPHYEAIPYLEVLYRPFFPRILYCGPEMPNLEQHPELKDLRFSFASYGGTAAGHEKGSFNYACTVTAIHMNYDVRGFLVIADDVLLLNQRLPKFSPEQVWFLPPNELRTGDIHRLRECRLGMCDYFPHWHWWEDYRPAVMDALDDLQTRSAQSPLAYKCLRELARLNGAPARINGGYSDVYYIPKKLAGKWAELAGIFLEHYVFLEIAVPTIMRCLSPPEDTLAIAGRQVWDKERDEAWRYFTRHDMAHKAYLHPTKWGLLQSGADLPLFTRFFCKILVYIHDPYTSIKDVGLGQDVE